MNGGKIVDFFEDSSALVSVQRIVPRSSYRFVHRAEFSDLFTLCNACTSLTAAPHEIRFVRNVVLVLDQRLTIGVSLDAYQMVLTHVLPAILCSRQCTVAIPPLFFRALEHAFSLKCIWEVVQFWSQKVMTRASDVFVFYESIILV